MFGDQEKSPSHRLLVYFKDQRQLFDLRFKKNLLGFGNFKEWRVKKEQEFIDRITEELEERAQGFALSYRQDEDAYFKLPYFIRNRMVSRSLQAAVKPIDTRPQGPGQRAQEEAQKFSGQVKLGLWEKRRWFIWYQENWALEKKWFGKNDIVKKISEMNWMEIYEPFTRTCIKCWKKESEIWEQDGAYKAEISLDFSDTLLF